MLGTQNAGCILGSKHDELLVCKQQYCLQSFRLLTYHVYFPRLSIFYFTGSGFRLSITTTGDHDEAKIAQCVKGTVGNAKLKENTKNTLVYDLPAGANLPTLFQNLEKSKAELNILLLSVGITTLEEVFLE